MNDTPHLEHYEWCHMWHDNSNLSPNEEKDSKRILFIGDSITHGSYPKCSGFLKAEYTKHKLNLDYLTTSKGIDNPDIIREINYMLSPFEYDYIHFNNGLHGMGLPNEAYEKCYDEVISHILERYPASKVALMTVTPLSKNGDTTVFRNEVVDARNISVRRIAEKHGLEIDDLYAVVAGKSEIRAFDGYHYTDEGYILLGRAMADFILKHI